jgi:hypothetical protein
LLTDFVCLYNYEFWLSLCKIVRSSVILLLPLFISNKHTEIEVHNWSLLDVHFYTRSCNLKVPMSVTSTSRNTRLFILMTILCSIMNNMPLIDLLFSIIMDDLIYVPTWNEKQKSINNVECYSTLKHRFKRHA